MLKLKKHQNNGRQRHAISHVCLPSYPTSPYVAFGLTFVPVGFHLLTCK